MKLHLTKALRTALLACACGAMVSTTWAATLTLPAGMTSVGEATSGYSEIIVSDGSNLDFKGTDASEDKSNPVTFTGNVSIAGTGVLNGKYGALTVDSNGSADGKITGTLTVTADAKAYMWGTRKMTVGALTLSSGTLNLNDDSSANGTLSVEGNVTGDGNLTIQRGSVVVNGTYTSGGTITNKGSLTFNSDAAIGSYSTSSTGSVVVASNKTLTIRTVDTVEAFKKFASLSTSTTGGAIAIGNGQGLSGDAGDAEILMAGKYKTNDWFSMNSDTSMMNTRLTGQFDASKLVIRQNQNFVVDGGTLTSANGLHMGAGSGATTTEKLTIKGASAIVSTTYLDSDDDNNSIEVQNGKLTATDSIKLQGANNTLTLSGGEIATRVIDLKTATSSFVMTGGKLSLDAATSQVGNAAPGVGISLKNGATVELKKGTLAATVNDWSVDGAVTVGNGAAADADKLTIDGGNTKAITFAGDTTFNGTILNKSTVNLTGGIIVNDASALDKVATFSDGANGFATGTNYYLVKAGADKSKATPSASIGSNTTITGGTLAGTNLTAENGSVFYTTEEGKDDTTYHVQDGTVVYSSNEQIKTAQTIAVADNAKLDLTGVMTLNAQNLILSEGSTLVLGEGALTFTGTLKVEDGAIIDISAWGTNVYDFYNVELFTGGTKLEFINGGEGFVQIYFGGEDTVLWPNWLITDEAHPGSVYAIPEPTTATLSLLALAGLAARRRRK